MSEAVLNCGHVSDWTGLAAGCTTSEGKRLCVECAHEHEVSSLLSQDRTCAYDSGEWLSTWHGGTLMRVIRRGAPQRRITPTGGHYTRVSLTAKDQHGNVWRGNSMGDGMLVRLRKSSVRSHIG